MLRWIVCLVAVVGLQGAMGMAQEKPDVSLPVKEKFHLFLLVGQSNMAGRGEVTDADRVPNPRVLVFTKERKWTPAADPLHFDKPASVGVGPGRAFAEEVAKTAPDVTIGLIPCAVGGSPISAWEPGVSYLNANTHPWDDAIARAKAALPHGTFKAILWHQGESDSTAALAPRYPEKLKSVVERFRTELAAPEVPFLVGQLGEFPSKPWDEFRRAVDAAHRDLPQRVPHAAYVSAAGLPDKGDGLHFNRDGAQGLGRRYAEAYLKLISGK